MCVRKSPDSVFLQHVVDLAVQLVSVLPFLPSKHVSNRSRVAAILLNELERLLHLGVILQFPHRVLSHFGYSDHLTDTLKKRIALHSLKN